MTLTYTYRRTANHGVVYVKTLPQNISFDKVIKNNLGNRRVTVQRGGYLIDIDPNGTGVTYNEKTYGVTVEFIGNKYIADGNLEDHDGVDEYDDDEDDDFKV